MGCRTPLAHTYQYDSFSPMDTNGNVVALIGSRHWFQRTVQRLAGDSGNVIATDHARQRMAVRDIALDEVLRVLRCGTCDEEPQPGHGSDWRARMVGSATGREIVASVAVVEQRRLVVVTAWLAAEGDLGNEGEGGA